MKVWTGGRVDGRRYVSASPGRTRSASHLQPSNVNAFSAIVPLWHLGRRDMTRQQRSGKSLVLCLAMNVRIRVWVVSSSAVGCWLVSWYHIWPLRDRQYWAPILVWHGVCVSLHARIRMCCIPILPIPNTQYQQLSNAFNGNHSSFSSPAGSHVPLRLGA